MADVERERAWVGELYPGRAWKDKVAKMDDKQVLAIYLREHRKAAKAKKTKESDPGGNPF